MASKVHKISGFPEWLPEQKLVENELIGRLRTLFESFGFSPLETSAVEHVATLQSKGVLDKEIYGVKRLAAAEGDDTELALHFDLTVPTARYVAQNLNSLVFPFKRYQIQKVWRGDRPQKGRFREFYQADVDIIGRGDLPLVADAEVVTILDRAYRALDIARHEIRCNTRKVLLGFYESVGISEEKRAETIRVVDKISKIGAEGVRKELTGPLGLSAESAEQVLKLSSLRFPARELAERVPTLGISNPLFETGIKELLGTFALLSPETLNSLVIDFSLARGLDYYTGIICEVSLVDYPAFATCGSGGRYDDLASQFTNEKLPGVGVSVGLSRIIDFAWSEGILKPTKRSPAKVVVTVGSEETRAESNRIADELRSYGVAVDVPLAAAKFGKQIDYADKRGIRYVLFLGEPGKQIEVKDLVAQIQSPVSDLKTWAAGL